MSVSSPFPNGWTLNNTQSGVGAGGTPASVSLAGQFCVAHVVDSLHAKIAAVTATAVAADWSISITLNGVVALTVLLAVPASEISTDSVDLQDLNLAAPAGTPIGAAFNGGPPTGLWQEIVLQGHNV